MRILQTISGMSASSGGPSTCTRDLLEGLESIQPNTVDLLTFTSPCGDNLGKNSRWLIEVTDDRRTPLQISSNFKQALFQSEYDLYHCNALWMYCNHLTCRYARHIGKPYILSPHGMLYPTALAIKSWKKKPMLWTWFNRDIHHASCIHATCEDEMRYCRKFGYKGPIAVIPNPVVIPQCVSMKETIDPHLTIGYLGRLDPIKRVENLLKGAAIALKNGCRSFKIEIMGSGSSEYEQFLRNETSRFGLNDIVQFVGFVSGSDKYDRLRRLRALFVPSLQENFGMIVPEALICGTPVYASLGTPWYELEQNNCGWWRDNSPETIAEVICELMSLDDEALLVKGNNGRMLIEEKYEQHKVAGMMLDLYHWLITGADKPDFCYTI